MPNGGAAVGLTIDLDANNDGNINTVELGSATTTSLTATFDGAKVSVGEVDDVVSGDGVKAEGCACGAWVDGVYGVDLCGGNSADVASCIVCGNAGFDGFVAVVNEVWLQLQQRQATLHLPANHQYRHPHARVEH